MAASIDTPLTDDDIRSLADELFDLEGLVTQAPTKEGGQLDMELEPAIGRKDPAFEVMMQALHVAQASRLNKRKRSGAGFHNRLREDLHKAWVALGGWRFLVACIASKDDLLRAWALSMFTKSATNMVVMPGAGIGLGGEVDEDFDRFVMALDVAPAERDRLVQSMANLQRESSRTIEHAPDND